jgi:hypothetical protein
LNNNDYENKYVTEGASVWLAVNDAEQTIKGLKCDVSISYHNVPHELFDVLRYIVPNGEYCRSSTSNTQWYKVKVGNTETTYFLTDE